MGLNIFSFESAALHTKASVEEFNASARMQDMADSGRFVFLYSADGVPDRADGLVDGLYRVSGASHSFRAGSYSGYNKWREMLADIAGYGTAKRVWDNPNASGPFVELIDYSDCEGFIGPRTSAKLAEDCARLVAGGAAKELPGIEDWAEAFRIAAGHGVVKFS